MGIARNALSLVVIYYIAQIGVLNYHVYILHKNPTIVVLEPETITKIKKVEKPEIRDNLTQEQLAKVTKAIAEEPVDREMYSLPDVTAYGDQISSQVYANIEKMHQLKKDIDNDIADISLPDMPQFGPSGPPKVPMDIPSLASFLQKTSFAGYSNSDLQNLLEVFESNLTQSPGAILNTSNLPKKSEKMDDCEKFLTRSRKQEVNEDFATQADLKAFVNNLLNSIEAIKDEPIDEVTKQRLLEEFHQESEKQYISVQDKVDSAVEQLKAFAQAKSGSINSEVDEPIEEDLGNCADEDDVQALIDIGFEAFHEKTSVFDALSEFVDGLDESIVAGEIDRESDEDDRETQLRTLKDLVSTPLYHKFIEAIDSSVDFVGGYNEALDNLIESIGGNEDFGVGKNVRAVLDKLLSKVQVPDEYSQLEKKAGV